MMKLETVEAKLTAWSTKNEGEEFSNIKSIGTLEVCNNTQNVNINQEQPYRTGDSNTMVRLFIM